MTWLGRLACRVGWHARLRPVDGAGRDTRYRCRRCGRLVGWPPSRL